jgi:hypothetical protein
MMCKAIKDFDDLSKLGQEFTSADPLEEVDISRPSARMQPASQQQIRRGA